MQAPLSLELGPGFVEGPIDDPQEAFAFIAEVKAPPGVELKVATPGHSHVRSLGPLPTKSIWADGLVASRKLGKAFASVTEGLWEFSLDSSSSSLLVGHPELASLTAIAADAPNGPHVAGIDLTARRRSSYRWALEVDEDAKRLYALYDQHLVHIDLESRAIVDAVTLSGDTAHISVDVKQGLVVLPRVGIGPTVVDLHGRPLAMANQHGREQWTAAIRPKDGAVLLGEQTRGLTLWNWRTDSWKQLTTSGTAPAFADENTFFFRESSSELWRCRIGAAPDLVVRAVGAEPGSAGSWQWVKRPLISNDACYIFVRMTVVGSATQHLSLFIDLADHLVHRVPGFLTYAASWL